MQLIISGIIGGLIVLIGLKFSQKRTIVKFLLRIYYVLRDYALTAGSEIFEKLKDLAAESRSEHEKEKAAERAVKME